MKEIMEFLTDLSQHNDREWFADNRARYETARESFQAFTESLIRSISSYDSSVAGLEAKSCTYRIHRDLRFTTDKRPYKIHMGCYICPGGRKSGYSGYYFQVGPRVKSLPDSGNFLAVGDYCCSPAVLKVLREDIESCGDAFPQALAEAHKAGFYLEPSFATKRMPKGFSENTPNASLLRYKVYCLMRQIPDEELFMPRLVERVAEQCRHAVPFLDFVNRAIAFVQHPDTENGM